MTKTTCTTCGGTYHWDWEDAFDKFGFDDGDGLVMTGTVSGVLRDAGYLVEAQPWGLHNIVIISIKRDDINLIPETANVGYDNPRKYLPKAIVELLDRVLHDSAETVS